MEDSRGRTLIKEQETARFSPADIEYISEWYEDIADSTERIPFNKFVIKAVQQATQATGSRVNKEMANQLNNIEQKFPSFTPEFAKYLEDITIYLRGQQKRPDMSKGQAIEFMINCLRKAKGKPHPANGYFNLDTNDMDYVNKNR